MILVLFSSLHAQHFFTLPEKWSLYVQSNFFKMYCIFLKDVVLVFVHVMTNGLLKVKLVGHQGKLVLPLINDMVIPKKCLGPLVRQTVVNLADRRRFDCDAYQPPLVKRRHLIQEIRYKYKSNLSEADLFTDLFAEN